MASGLNVASISALVGQATRALFRHKTRSALNALGVMIGIASVVWVVAIGNAGAAMAEEQLHNLGDNLVWIEAGSRNVNGVRSGTLGMHSLTLEDSEAILKEVPSIRRISPQIDGNVLVAFEARNWTTRYRGVAPDYLAIKRWTIAEGGVYSDEQVERAAAVCIIGKTVRDKIFGDAPAVGEVVRMAGQSFEVVGVLAPKGQSATGMDQDDAIFIPHTTALKKMRGNGQTWVDDVVCSAATAEDVRTSAAQITDLLRQRHHLGPDQEDDFNVRKPEELIAAQLEASRTFAALLISIASVSLLVGGIGVMNVMLASVVERTKEIGVRLAVGAPAWAIELQFLAEAVLLTAFGGALGILASIFGSSALARLLGWAITIPPSALVIAVAFSLGTGVVFGFVPARRAARLDPVRALQSE